MVSFKFRWILDIILLITFIIVSISGIVLWLILPQGSGRYSTFILTRSEWVTLHDYFGIVFMVSAVAHLLINWKCLYRWSCTIISKKKR